MGLRTRLINALGGTELPQKQKNSVSGRDFLLGRDKYKGNDILYPTWDEVKMSDQDLYKGYSYAVIQKRGNKVATLARDNLKTWVKPEALEIFQAHEEVPLHPYLKVVENSTKFTEKRFWKDISIYLDLTGVYYLGVVRNRIASRNPEKFPDLYSDVSEFVMLNPYEVHRIFNKDGEIGGYVERKQDGRERIWAPHQIIEMRELNPFDDKKSWSITDAAKESVYTLRQSGDYARQALNGNLDSPGILTTDVILEDEDFANFRERVRQHRRGEPLFGNGAGAIHWENTQVNLDQAALPSLNEIYRTTLFAVSGTSKTSLGIEQSGTTRETARVQNENFAQDTALPRLEDIIDFLNLDYKQRYKSKYDQIGYTIEVDSVSGTDYQTEIQATQARNAQFTLSQDIIYAGYTEESARQYAMGEIELTDLQATEFGGDNQEGGEESNPPENPEQPENPTEPETPESPSEPDTPSAEETNTLKELEGIEPHADLKLEEHNHICEEDEESPTIDFYENRLTQDDNKTLNEAYQALLKDVSKVQKEAINFALENVTANAFEESDITTEEQKNSLTQRLKNAFQKYWKVLFPLFGAALVSRRNKEFNADYTFKFTNELQEIVDKNGARVAEGHIETTLKDILKVTNGAYEKAIEKQAVDLISKAYDNDPARFSAWFTKKPTKKQIATAIQNTDILEINRRLYERANELATQGEARESIVKTIRREFNRLSRERAELIARNETSRAFGHSQYDADLQFLNSIGKLDSAYKELYSRTGNPCEFCQALINQGPIPFTQNFLDYGETITVDVNGKVKNFTANYEDIKASTIHPRCNCSYRLVFLNEAGKVTSVYNSLWGEKPNTSDSIASEWLTIHSNNATKQEEITNQSKGNPYHDKLGRFASKTGSKAESAKPTEHAEKPALENLNYEEAKKLNETAIEEDGKYYRLYYWEDRDSNYNPTGTYHMEKVEVTKQAADYINDRKKALDGKDAFSFAYAEASAKVSRKYAKGVANRDTFFEDTFAEFEPVAIPNRPADYTSRSGSQYWYSKDGVIRASDHWSTRDDYPGPNGWQDVASCSWFRKGGYEEGTRTAGKAKWTDFVPKLIILGDGSGGPNDIYQPFLEKVEKNSFDDEIRTLNEVTNDCILQ